MEALNRGDAQAYIDYLHSDHSRFLVQNPTILREIDAKSMQENFANGMSFNMQLSDLEVSLFGNTAVVTGYESGPAKFPDGTVIDGKRKYSSVWVRENGEWKNVHLHISMVE